ncbi:hypothetical protein ABUW04_18010 [Streptacidiphilus sp. N1-10]|uniref:Uncharacterized protein n=1 Tax=Streptacidiphilus jeojiensis TaxID=3229225 RepID=A0ABV6XQ93_9ACTN
MNIFKASELSAPEHLSPRRWFEIERDKGLTRGREMSIKLHDPGVVERPRPSGNVMILVVIIVLLAVAMNPEQIAAASTLLTGVAAAVARLNGERGK